MYTLIIILEEVNVIVALAERITGYLVSKNIITEEEYDVYEYGYELLASSLLGVSLIIVSSIILDCLDIAVFFLCVFCGVRTFTGGFHADSYLKCNTIFVVIFVSINYIVKNLNCIQNINLVLIVMCFISTLVISIYAPLENSNKLLSEENKKRNKTKSIISVVVLHIVEILLYSGFRKYSITIEVCLLCVALLLVIGKIKEEYYEE